MPIVLPRIYLASQSPRRRELLRQLGVHYEVLLLRSDPRRDLDVDETPAVGELPADYVQRVSRQKALAGWAALEARMLPAFPVLSADTEVVLGGRIFGKPADAAEAAGMLHELAGREHEVLTAVTVTFEERIETVLNVTRVQVAPLDEERIRGYLLTREYADKAGGYGIQGYAGSFVERIEGSYSGVMGLPLFETAGVLRRFGYPLP